MRNLKLFLCECQGDLTRTGFRCRTTSDPSNACRKYGWPQLSPCRQDRLPATAAPHCPGRDKPKLMKTNAGHFASKQQRNAHTFPCTVGAPLGGEGTSGSGNIIHTARCHLGFVRIVPSHSSQFPAVIFGGISCLRAAHSKPPDPAEPPRWHSPPAGLHSATPASLSSPRLLTSPLAGND